MKTLFKFSLMAIAGMALASCQNETVQPDYGPKGIDQKAPVISRKEIFVAAPLSRVWQLHTDINNWPNWNKGITKAQLNGPLKAGRSFDWTAGGLAITSTISEVVPQQRLVWSGPAQGLMGIHVWTFKAVNGGVLLQTEESWDGEPVRAQPTLMQQTLDQSIQAWLGAIKQQAER